MPNSRHGTSYPDRYVPKPKGRKATKDLLTQIKLQELADKYPVITKACIVFTHILDSIGSDKLETDFKVKGAEYHFSVTRTKKASGIILPEEN